ncbi:N-acetyltransferase [Pseudorhizobium halotolerans]|uniref:N-acetyltransferase n=2 Tax=Pseudorhizobium halotolerans TaxID=1233081 RepID=A0ABN7JZV4_9HYPH|nr:N-acetyltransferase [Pseudorhizobium halotolerans]
MALLRHNGRRLEADADFLDRQLCWRAYFVRMANYVLTLVEDAADAAAYDQIRHHVLFGGSHAYIRNGPEEVKDENLSLLLKLDGIPIGTVRLDQKTDKKAIVRLVAIVSDLQRAGHGTALMGCLEGLATTLGIRELLVYARPAASGFYLRLGYTPFIFDPDNKESIQLHKMIS